MENRFYRYVADWFDEFLDEHENDETLIGTLFELLLTEEALAEWPTRGQTMFEYLRYGVDAEWVHTRLYVEELGKDIDDIPSYEEFLAIILKKSADSLGIEYDFAEEFIDDMAYHIVGYDEIQGFFNDLQNHGCVSGMIGMLIYNDDCLKLYGKHANEMEEYKEDLEDELGEPIRQEKDKRIYHYVWMCWLCYEELAYQIARDLFEDEF